MKSRFILLAVLIGTGFTSCSVYKSGQTPDDVYYSPNRPAFAGTTGSGDDEYVDVRSRQSSRYQSSSRYNNYDDYYYDQDTYLRMRVRNPYAYSRWSMFDNYWNDWGMYGGYGPGLSLGYNSFYSPWYNSFYNPMYGYYGGWNHGWNSYYYWNSFYNPYCGGGIVVVDPKTNPAAYTKVRNFSLSSYNNSGYNNRNTSLNSRGTRSSYRLPSGIGVYNNNNRTTTNSYRNTNSGNAGRYYNPRGNSDRPSRTYTPPSNTSTNSRSTGGSYGGNSGSSGRSSGGTGGGGGVSRPGRN